MSSERKKENTELRRKLFRTIPKGSVMPNEIWVFAEQQEGKVRKVTFELLTAVAEFSKKTNQAVGSDPAGKRSSTSREGSHPLC